MFTRSAIFEGTIHKGQEDAFFRMVVSLLPPVLLCFLCFKSRMLLFF